ncbi:MAG: NAD(P)-dependent oxidoreductase [Phycisphaeraceae bacterium]|nr:NAD(P)-dependent oxidoreductase [Phycisphaeraceae bacterium]
MSPPKVVVTGAGGFIGRHLAEHLAEETASGQPKWRVIGVDLHFHASPSASKGVFEIVQGDFRDSALMQPVLQGAKVVYHLAAAHLQKSLPDSAYRDINVHSLKPLLTAARAAGVRRFVHVSSVGIYGNLKTWPADEEAPKEPQSIYGITKLEGEIQALQLGKELGLEVAVIRPAWVFGPGCPRTAKLYRALRKGRFIMIGRGDNLRHPLYIDDLVAAMKLAAEHPQAVGETFIIAGPQPISTRQLVEEYCQVLGLSYPKIRIPYVVGLGLAITAEALCGILGKEPPISRRALEFFDTNNAFNIGKADRLLGFTPHFSFAQGIKATASWLQAG